MNDRADLVRLFHAGWMLLVMASAMGIVLVMFITWSPRLVFYVAIPVWVQNFSTWIWGNNKDKISKTCPLSRLENALRNNEQINRWWILQPIITAALVTVATIIITQGLPQ